MEICPNCEDKFEKTHYNQIYCSADCRLESANERTKKWQRENPEKHKEYVRNYQSTPEFKKKQKEYMKNYFANLKLLPADPTDTRLDRFIGKLNTNTGIKSSDTRMTSTLTMLETIGAIEIEDDNIYLNYDSPYLAAFDGFFEEAEARYYNPNFEKPKEWQMVKPL
jgi:hypothetical protein